MYPKPPKTSNAPPRPTRGGEGCSPSSAVTLGSSCSLSLGSGSLRVLARHLRLYQAAPRNLATLDPSARSSSSYRSGVALSSRECRRSTSSTKMTKITLSKHPTSLSELARAHLPLAGGDWRAFRFGHRHSAGHAPWARSRATVQIQVVGSFALTAGAWTLST